jgi:hypothetical protein
VPCFADVAAKPSAAGHVPTDRWLRPAFPGEQLSPRGSTVTTSMPFAPGFGGAVGAGHSRGAHGVKGDPDYTPPSDARCTYDQQADGAYMKPCRVWHLMIKDITPRLASRWVATVFHVLGPLC